MLPNNQTVEVSHILEDCAGSDLANHQTLPLS